MKQFQENVPLLPYTTFKMGGPARFFMDITSEEELVWALDEAEARNLRIVILGGGSNVIIKDNEIDALVLRIAIPEFSVISKNNDETIIRMGAGEIWDQCVARAISMGLSGIEALSGIPGTAGATPIQNVGAYGQEVKNTIVSVRALDRTTKQFMELSNKECAFAYRDSIFKHEGKNQYIVTAVTFKLSHEKPSIPDYPGVTDYFVQRNITEPTLAQIRNAIIAIRKTKLPDPKDIPSVGSFFKNPIVSQEKADALKQEFPKLFVFPQPNGMARISSALLIDAAGLKGKAFGDIEVYKNNALVLINAGHASFKDLETAAQEIKNAVHDRFAIWLEQEPDVIG